MEPWIQKICVQCTDTLGHTFDSPLNLLKLYDNCYTHEHSGKKNCPFLMHIGREKKWREEKRDRELNNACAIIESWEKKTVTEY